VTSRQRFINEREGVSDPLMQRSFVREALGFFQMTSTRDQYTCAGPTSGKEGDPGQSSLLEADAALNCSREECPALFRVMQASVRGPHGASLLATGLRTVREHSLSISAAAVVRDWNSTLTNFTDPSASSRPRCATVR
jgi:hypothetical protein